MRALVITLLGSVLVLTGVIAQSEASGNSGPSGSSAETLMGAGFQCFGNETEGFELILEVGGRGEEGGAIGVQSNGFTAFRSLSGPCETAVASLIAVLPSAPFCVVALGQSGFSASAQIACSGPTEKVIGAFADLAKATLALP